MPFANLLRCLRASILPLTNQRKGHQHLRGYIYVSCVRSQVGLAVSPDIAQRRNIFTVIAGIRCQTYTRSTNALQTSDFKMFPVPVIYSLCSLNFLFSNHYRIKAEPLRILKCGNDCWSSWGTSLIVHEPSHSSVVFVARVWQLKQFQISRRIASPFN